MTNQIAKNVAAKVAYLKSVADDLDYDVAAILRKEAKFLRTKKAEHNHIRAEMLEQAANNI